ncbi:hypothetical protein [Lysobacter sp. Root690]|uniref:hypothetical protein n=1 Tax=Lysobacter sp. Root690 TaxID=1736588 RepID=UPI0012FB019E|nr:hypothetical protein [Lysobacter sp. Root690]
MEDTTLDARGDCGRSEVSIAPTVTKMNCERHREVARHMKQGINLPTRLARHDMPMHKRRTRPLQRDMFLRSLAIDHCATSLRHKIDQP